MTTTIFAGLPRSGTTLICALLNKLPNTIALAEPLNPVGDNPDSSIAQLKDFISETRRSALRDGQVINNHFQGEIIDNFFPEPNNSTQLRYRLAQHGRVKVQKTLSPDFHLYIKQWSSPGFVDGLVKSF